VEKVTTFKNANTTSARITRENRGEVEKLLTEESSCCKHGKRGGIKKSKERLAEKKLKKKVKADKQNRRKTERAVGGAST